MGQDTGRDGAACTGSPVPPLPGHSDLPFPLWEGGAPGPQGCRGWSQSLGQLRTHPRGQKPGLEHCAVMCSCVHVLATPSRRPLDRTFQPGPLSVQDQDSASDPEGAWGCAGSWEPCALVPVITLKPRAAGVVLKSCRFTCLVAMEAPTWAKTSMTEK